MLQIEFETEAAAPGNSAFVLVTAMCYSLATKCLTSGCLT